MTGSWTFERVAGPFEYTEGPVWDGEFVLFSDIPNERVMQYDPAADECTVFRERTNAANGLKIGPDGYLYACERDAHRIARYEAGGGRTVVVSEDDGTRLNSPNDLAFDGDGRLWFTDPDYLDKDDLELGHYSVYRVDLNSPVDEWAVERMTYDTNRPNGLLVSPDDKTLFVAESHFGEGNDRELRTYPITDDGLGEYEILHNFYPHRGIDGMCFDADGNIVATAGWNESGPGPMLYVFAQNGRVIETHPFPTEPPTNCCFGDDDLSVLYVTGYDGCLYRAETNRTGLLGAPDRIRFR